MINRLIFEITVEHRGSKNAYMNRYRYGKIRLARRLENTTRRVGRVFALAASPAASLGRDFINFQNGFLGARDVLRRPLRGQRRDGGDGL